MENDHDLLIKANQKLDNVIGRIDQINGHISSHYKQIEGLKLKQENVQTRLEVVEDRPSAVKAIITTGTIIGIINAGLIVLFKIM